ncbi:hypothetical protein [Massilia sp. Root1485]|uniref:hypothetical protein n=1 Tax=Massilia sp. Root1485 TaxID=1736472 RepID=UPI0006F5BADF|nr:hypothetical protein [Massilia sp. Root1485]KQZ34303.1 hypothetical protein ASD92_08290 [Massilia sp. Root1485]
MAITALLDPALLPARTMDEASFNAAMAYLMTNLPVWGQQTNALQATLNSLAAGGAYALPYTFSSSASEVDPGSGKLGLSSTPQTSSVALRVNTTNSAGVDSLSLLNDFSASTSSVTGTVRLQKVGDPSKWLVFAVTAAVQYTGYMRLTVIGRGGSTGSPFVAGDSLMLFFQRTGDKGDTNSGSPTLHLREERASGTGSTAPTNLGTGVNRRPLNTVKVNTITGASLASDQFVLPAGTYDVEAESLSFVQTGSTGQKYWNKMALYNVTDAAYVVIGLNGLSYDPASNGLYVQMSPPSLAGTFAIAASKTFELRHLTPNAAMYGVPASSSGQVEVYTDLVIRKTS